mmetsp:Transcript_31349/g.34690  ORF Transcript_31349/g.34690 Transcript_31349/m.34690 type:complete len:107 (-) Transcript_31349:2401-2721(-)
MVKSRMQRVVQATKKSPTNSFIVRSETHQMIVFEDRKEDQYFNIGKCTPKICVIVIVYIKVQTKKGSCLVKSICILKKNCFPHLHQLSQSQCTYKCESAMHVQKFP